MGDAFDDEQAEPQTGLAPVQPLERAENIGLVFRRDMRSVVEYAQMEFGLLVGMTPHAGVQSYPAFGGELRGIAQ